MNAHTHIGAAPTVAADLEPAVNDLARLGYVTELLVSSLFEELAAYAKDGFSAADALKLVERKREVVVAHVEDVEIQTRQLRQAFYAAA